MIQQRNVWIVRLPESIHLAEKSAMMNGVIQDIFRKNSKWHNCKARVSNMILMPIQVKFP
jgi:hypothetical protein